MCSVVLLSSAAPLLWISHFLSLSTQPERPLPCVQPSLQGCVQVRCTLPLGSLPGILTPQLLGYIGSYIQKWTFQALLHVLNFSEVEGNLLSILTFYGNELYKVPANYISLSLLKISNQDPLSVHFQVKPMSIHRGFVNWTISFILQPQLCNH